MAAAKGTSPGAGPRATSPAEKGAGSPFNKTMSIGWKRRGRLSPADQFRNNKCS